MSRRKHSKIAGSYRVFDVLSHDMEDEHGEPQGEAFTFTCPDWVSVVPVTAAGDFVLVRQYRHGIDAYTLETPGGVVDSGEAPEATARRELSEETGYEVAELVPLGFAHPNPPLQDNRFFMFLGKGATLAGKPAFDANESCEVVLLSRAALAAKIDSGDITHALVLLALQRAFCVLGTG